MNYVMYRIRIRPFFLLCLLCGLLSSCLEDIDLDTGEQILNVYCVLKEGPEQELELSYIAPTGGTSSPVGEDVTITLFESGIPVGVFTRTSETKWRMDYTPEGGANIPAGSKGSRRRSAHGRNEISAYWDIAAFKGDLGEFFIWRNRFQIG